MTEGRRTRRWIHAAASGFVAIALAPVLAIPFLANPAAAETEEEALAKKDLWQGRYRELRNNAVRMRENAKKLRRAYGLAQHANYPRGGAREDFRLQVEKAEHDADDYEAKLVAFHDEARQNDVPPGWLYEVDDEPIDHGLPAAQDETDVDENEDREGRNPIYRDEEAGDTADSDEQDADDADAEDDPSDEEKSDDDDA